MSLLPLLQQARSQFIIDLLRSQIYEQVYIGSMHSMTTYSCFKGQWKQLVPTFLIPTGCDTLSAAELQKKVFREGNTIYYFDTDPNTGKRMKKKVM
ncbi:MAG TPA: hypothetical protein VM802_23880 [Chitinophaga sp.]|uniref:hypothetical protein n=1 Tax=Chitinophaga sp. TaxID=1869181 RepID=UPI002BF8601A|nr:hypothetical protein [Chitinophaga sp.]HVI47928.1 hypothetical protein [Chitinophaga sp.]